MTSMKLWMQRIIVPHFLLIDFDTLDHRILCQRLLEIGLADQAVGWFSNYFSHHRQCAQCNGLSSSFLIVSNGVPLGSVLGPTLFTIYVNNVGQNVNTSVQFYADDIMIYCCVHTIDLVFKHLQTALTMIQSQQFQLKLV